MGAIVSSLVSSVGICFSYCAFQSASQLCEVCFGNSDATTSGRKRSILLLVVNVALSLLFQYSWAPSLERGNDITKIPYFGYRIKNAFSDGCADVFPEPSEVTKCIGYAGVYRATFVSTVFFLIMSLAVANNPSINRRAWPAKYTLCMLCLLVTFFVPNSPVFFGFYLWVARIGASLFLVIQQIILIDLAYSWNESWLQKSSEAESVEYGSGKKWLIAIVVAVVLLFGACLFGIIFLYKQFSGCPTNNVLITMTLILILVLTGIQVTGEEGNLLTSAIMSSYAIYLVTSAMSHNPNGKCNPFLENDGKLGIAIGIIITFVSLVWTVWSWTDERVFTTKGMKENPSNGEEDAQGKPLDGLDIPFLEEQNNNVTGVVMEESESSSDWSDNELWKLNLVFALISTWVTVTLTGWGSVTSSGGMIDLWFIIISQWTAIGLYIWTLVAPRLFPDRDFS